jgi:hypothetical protein
MKACPFCAEERLPTIQTRRQRRAEAQRRIDRYKSAKSQHANCARSFERLFIGGRTAAEACFKAVDEYWESKS